MKRILSFFLFLIFLVSITPTQCAFAAVDPPYTGTCGNNLRWALYNSGELRIWGTGSMNSFKNYCSSPWYYQSSLIKKITILPGVTNVGNYAFYTCSKATEIILPDSITSLGTDSFAYCASLKSIKLPENIQCIGENAFYGCGLQEITIPTSCKSFSRGVLAGCSELMSINVPEENVVFSSIDGVLFDKNKSKLIFYPMGRTDTYTIPNTVTTIGTSAFFGANITQVSIPDSVTIIESSAFRECKKLEYLNIPDSVTQIESAAFYECDSLISISLPNELKVISEHLFFDCDSLSSIRIPKSVVKIGEYSFYYCAYLSDIYYTGTKSEWDETLRNRTWNQTIHYNWSDDWEEAKTWQINESGLLTIDMTGPMRDFESPYMSTQNLPWYKERKNIKNVIINEDVTSIGTHAFHECVNLKEAKIPDSVTKINLCAFSHCSNMTSISFSANVTSIGDNAFYNCNNLSDIYFGGTEKEWNKISIGENNEWLLNATVHYLKEHTITYDYVTNGGISASKTNDIVITGKNAELSVTATKPEWEFVGWNINPNATTALSSYTVTGDTTLYAIFKKTLTGSFYYGNNSLQTTKTVTIYNKATSGSITIPSLTGYSGWSTDGWRDDTTASSKRYSNSASVSISSDTKFYGIYSRSLTLSYNANGGSTTPSSESKTQYYNASGNKQSVSFTLASAISKSGATFSKWAKGSTSGTGYSAGSSISISDNTTMYATWNANSHTLTYSANGGSGAPSPQDGTTLTISSTIPTYFPRTFLGWSKLGSATSPGYLPGGTISLTGDTTLYAVWSDATTLSTSLPTTSSGKISIGGTLRYFKFTPSTSGTYIFESTLSEGDSYGYLYNSGGSQLAYNDDGGSENGNTRNFKISYELTSGTTYYFAAKYYGTSTTGTIPVKLSKQTLKVSTPTMQATNIMGGKRIDISCSTSGATIYYTTNGTTPTTSSTKYTASFNITTSGTITVKAIAVCSGYENSDVASTNVSLSKVSTPAASPSGGTITSSTSVSLSCSTSGATIYYTTNGNTPTTSSTKYTGSITINSTTTLKAIAVAPGYGNSDCVTYTYTYTYQVNTYTVTFNANGGTGTPAPQNKEENIPLTLSSHKPSKTYAIQYNATGGSVTPASKNVSCTFSNWNTEKSGNGTSYTSGSVYDSNANITLYAQWINPLAGTLAVPSRSGYDFVGWFTSAVGGVQVTEFSTVTENTTLYAHWAADSYNMGDETYSFTNYGDSDSFGGHCFGMSITSSGYHNKWLDIGRIGGNDNTPLYSFSKTQKVKQPICYYQGIQGNYARNATVAGGSYYLYGYYDIDFDWQDAVNYVKNHNYDNTGLLQIGFRKNNEGGHAINFLRYENVNGQDRIYAYDNNFPDIESYFYQDSSGRVWQTPVGTFSGSIDCIALRDSRIYFNSVGDFDATHVLYMAKNTATVQDYNYSYMEGTFSDEDYVMYEIPASQDRVIIIPNRDYADFIYMGTEYSFGEITDETRGELRFASLDEDSGNTEAYFRIFEIESNVSDNIKFEIVDLIPSFSSYRSHLFGSITTNIKNGTESKQSATVVLGIYDATGRMISIESKSYDFNSGNNEVTFNNIFLENAANANCKIKCFVLNTLTGMKPMSVSMEKNIE